MTTESVTTPTRLRYVGRSVPSRIADVVVTGELQDITDISLPGMLYGSRPRAEVHATVVFWDSRQDVSGKYPVWLRC